MARRNARQKKNKNNDYYYDYMSDDKVVDINKRNEHFSQSRSSSKSHSFKPQTSSQKHFVSAIKANTVTFGLGPAGTGKTYCTAAIAAEYLMNGLIDRIVFTRPAVEAGPSMGFLPGKLDDKFDPYFSAFKNCLVDIMGKGVVECALKNGNLTTEPLAYMRGKTFNNAFVVLDEAQNCTEGELKMFITRIGKGACFVINGDMAQTDIGQHSGLFNTIRRVDSVNQVHVHEFETDDIVRSGIVKDILCCYQ